MEINLLDYPKLMEMLKYLYLNKKCRATDVSKNCDIHYSYVSKQLNLLEGLKLIQRKKTGREVIINLTDRGRGIGEKVYEIKKLMKKK